MSSSVLRSGVVLLACAASTLHAQSKVIQKTYHVQGHAALQLNADDAGINASSCGSCADIQVRVDFRDADPNRYTLKEEQSGNSIHFELKRKPMTSWFSGMSHGPEITVLVPTGSDNRLSTGSGSVFLRGVQGQQELHSGSGGVTAEHIDGALLADTGSGSIHLGVLHGNVSANTGSGTIDVDGVVNLHRVTTGSGSIHLNLEQGSMIDGGALVETGSGSIEIRMSPSMHANLRVDTGSGTIHTDLPVTVQGDVDKHSLSGTLNGGGPTLRVNTGSGTISLRAI